MHLGGDEVDADCWKDQSQIDDFMAKNKIKDYEELQLYYRKRQKKILREINDKKAIYWANEEINLDVEPDDIIQWWGESWDIQQLKGKDNPIILSYWDIAYLDTGYGDELADHYRTYVRWR